VAYCNDLDRAALPAAIGPPLFDRGELSADQFRVHQEAERIQQLALLHQPSQHRVRELSQLTAVGMPEHARSEDFQREGQVALIGKGGGGGDECFRLFAGQQVESSRSFFPNVKALVYINAFIPDQGESALGLDSSQPGSVLGAGPPNTVFSFVPFPGATPGDALLYVKPSVFLQGFANDLPAKEGAVLEATQGPAVFSALTAPSGPPAWKTIPSWDLLGTIDNAIPSSIQLFMANRAHAHITEVKAGHLSMISQPDAVTKVIVEAAQSVAG